MSTVLLSGALSAIPRRGGATWAVLQYLLGLQRLGCQVFFVEPIPASALQPAGTSLAESDNAAYFRQVVHEFGLERCSTLLLEGTGETVGLDYAALRDAARHTDLLLNLSGLLRDPALLDPIPTRAYVDLDPAFSQLRQAALGVDMGFDRHTHWATVGLGVGTPESTVPTLDLPWITTLQPVVLDQWPVHRQLTRHALTTVADWRADNAIEHDGATYGQAAHFLRQCIDLPMQTDEQFLLALSVEGDATSDIRALDRHGWRLVDADRVAGTPDAYRRFIQRSWAELGVAKSGYVEARSGWFGDSGACYLASGRPVVAQDTGFGRFLPTGKGLFAFETCDDVLAAIRALRHDYGYHARAARALAEEHFDSKVVLGGLLSRLGVAA